MRRPLGGRLEGEIRCRLLWWYFHKEVKPDTIRSLCRQAFQTRKLLRHAAMLQCSRNRCASQLLEARGYRRGQALAADALSSVHCNISNVNCSFAGLASRHEGMSMQAWVHTPDSSRRAETLAEVFGSLKWRPCKSNVCVPYVQLCTSRNLLSSVPSVFTLVPASMYTRVPFGIDPWAMGPMYTIDESPDPFADPVVLVPRGRRPPPSGRRSVHPALSVQYR